MENEIALSKRLFLSECGYSEQWLGARIYEDPAILGLGDLSVVGKEVLQSSGGRLDLLLKDEEDGMYEVELQLDPTDESHIIRTIEYWDLERKRWPQRSHTAVLVAERITSRFYNVVRLLSNAVPIIGIQANIVEVGGQKALDFVTIIDAYEEPEEEETVTETFDRQHWVDNYPWVLEMAEYFRGLLVPFYGETAVVVRYTRYQIALSVGGLNKAWFNKRKSDRALLEVKCTESDFQEIESEMEKRGMEFRVSQKWKSVSSNVNLQQLKDKQEVWKWLAPRISPKKMVGKGGEGHAPP